MVYSLEKKIFGSNYIRQYYAHCVDMCTDGRYFFIRGEFLKVGREALLLSNDKLCVKV